MAVNVRTLPDDQVIDDVLDTDGCTRARWKAWRVPSVCHEASVAAGPPLSVGRSGSKRGAVSTLARNRRSELEVALGRSVETAVTEMTVASEELMGVADALPWRSRHTALHLQSVARRLSLAAQGLSEEVRLGPDPEAVALHLGLGRRALAIGVGLSLMLGQGMADAVTDDLYGHLTGRTDRIETAFLKVDELTTALQNLEELDEGDDRDSGPALSASQGAERAGFSGKEAAQIVGVTYRQLDYWARTDLLRPTIAHEIGAGSRRLYGHADLVCAELVRTFLDAGVPMEAVREVMGRVDLQVLDDRFTSIEIESGELRFVRRDGAVERWDGQILFGIGAGAGVFRVTLEALEAQVDGNVAAFLMSEREADQGN